MERASEVLFMPFMQIPSGHHHVADALIDEIKHSNQHIVYDKVDILSYSYGRMERVVTGSYLAWIRFFPDIYNWLYHHAAYREIPVNKRNYLYETLFTYFFKRLMDEKKPRIIFCTHALPSNIASVLKQKGQLDAIVVNVYTDFFVNRVWGIQGIDYHFVPTSDVKEFLVKKGVCNDCILVTGIPVHPAISFQKSEFSMDKQISVMVTGGNLGVGAMKQLLMHTHGDVHYHVLCGKNEKLYKKLVQENKVNVTPYGYISSREKMNELYERVDAVVTKPGGVTISESLRKQKPIFVYQPLPGQETINATELKKQGLIIPISLKNPSLNQQIESFFSNPEKHSVYKQKLDEYHEGLEKQPTHHIVGALLNRLE